jgi:tRNA uracil 4-sulfurtransferase
MQECLLVKTSSEISLKSKFVETFFLNKLVNSIKLSLKANNLIGSIIEKSKGRLFIYSNHLSELKKILKNVFGIHSFVSAKVFTEKNFSDLMNSVLNEFNLSEFNSFSVRAKTRSKRFGSNKEIEIKAGSIVLEKFSELKVNLNNPEVILNLEVFEKNVIVFNEKEIIGLNGLPLGCEGNIGVLFNGNELDVLTAFMLMRRGCNIFPVIESVNVLIKKQLNLLSKFNAFREFNLINLSELEKNDFDLKAIALSEFNLIKLHKKFNLPVLFPLLFLPESFLNEKKELIGIH